MDVLRETVFEKKKIRGAERITIDLKKKGEVTYVTFSGKKAKPPATGSPVAEVEVPDGYRDPAPFAFQKGDVVAILGNGLADRMQHDGWTETLLQSELKGEEVSFRNMSLSGDRPDKYPRSKGFTPMGQYLQHVKADVVFAMFGYNESFSGPQAADSHKKLLIDFVAKIRSYKPNGKDFPRIVLFSPIAFEDLKDRNLPRGKAHNKNLSAFAKATKDAAREAGVAYVDLFEPSLKLYDQEKQPLTINGVHLNEFGNKKVGEVIAQALLKKQIGATTAHEELREAVLEKNWHWHNRYRATDGNDVWGGRSNLRFVDDQSNAEVLQHELVMLDVMTANRDKLVWATAQGKDYRVDDGNVPPPIKVISNVGGRSRSSNAGKEGTI
ncbi:MAG: SGNH/GDSL hydrolase family protein, partial [Verrucomicrobiota bacterium]|nr:SGNH/GDSL hydrolase family protein [Verrucomicrobiota bacterium]